MKKGTTVAVVGVAAALVGVAWLVQPRPGSDEKEPGSRQPEPGGAAGKQSEEEVAGRLRSEYERLAAGKEATPTKASLEDLRRLLLRLPADVAGPGIVDFLDRGLDAPTGLAFKIGRNQALEEASSFRVFLLDVLADVDRATAGSYAEAVLQSKDSADEWAVSLRNYARANQTPEGNVFLEQKVRELVGHGPWLENPSAGFLESFDVFVYTSSTASTRLLSKLAARGAENSESDAVAFAAFLTLDRLTQSRPETMFDALAGEPALLGQRGQMVSNFFARADVRDPRQRADLESYLLDPTRTDHELKSLAGVYPNNNRMISNNLLTIDQTPTGADLIAHDREALAVVGAWSEDARFDRIRPHIETMTRRLQEFVRQASQ